MKTIYTLARLVEEDDLSAEVLDWDDSKMTRIVLIREYFETEAAARRWIAVVNDPNLLIFRDYLHEDSDV
jgi:hypothetical protein